MGRDSITSEPRPFSLVSIMGLGLNIQRIEQQLRLEKHSMPGGIVTDDLAADAVVTAKIPDNAITTAKILDANVTTAKMAAGATTLPKMTFTGIKVLAAAGKNGAGAITLTGTVVGDRLVAVFGAPTAGGTLAVKVPGTDFEATVTVVDQIQQIPASNLSANTYIFILVPAAA